MEKVSKDWLKLLPTLNEAQKRWLAGILASEIGYGGVGILSVATNISKTTIIKGKKEVKASKLSLSLDIRKKGGGRKGHTSDKELIKEIEKILAEITGGDPMSPIKWTCADYCLTDRGLMS